MTLATYIISVVTEVTVIPPALLAKTLLYRKPFSHQLFGYPEIVYQKKKKNVRVSVDFSSRIVDHHYSWIQYLQIHILTETYL